eukprot:gene3384-4195_t
MAVDHGLQGKDSKRSKEKRAKRALRNKALALKGLVGGKRKEVVFDENVRKEWLTGFRKRKQERRKYGLAMQILKDKKSLLEKRKSVRVRGDFQPLSVSGNNNEILNSNFDDLGSSEKFDYNDEAVKNMFGGEVSVVVDAGIADSLAAAANPDLIKPAASRNFNSRAKIELEKAMKKAKSLMGNKKTKKNQYRKSEKSVLLNKALGAS